MKKILTDQSTFLDEVFVILVLYQQKLSESESFKSLTCHIPPTSQVSFFVFDNSTEACSLPDTPGIEIIYQHHSSNPGVSAAYNQGFKIAKERKKKWLLFADQDTSFPKSILQDYGKAIDGNSGINVFVPLLRDRYGIISPFRYSVGKGIRVKSLLPGIKSLHTYCLINSGLMVSLSSYEMAGGYDEQLPLDYCDVLFTEQLARFYPDFILVNSICHHHFSDSHSPQDLSSHITRFISFCNAARQFKKLTSRFMILSWVLLTRALKLSFRFQRLIFLKIAIQHIRR